MTVIQCTFNRIDVAKDEANITYFFKVVENSTHFYGESLQTIAVSESPYYAVYERNPTDNNGKITLTARGMLDNWCYLQVIAQVQKDTILEYVAYDGIKLIRPPEEGESNDKKEGESSSGGATAFFVIAIILIVVIVGLVAVVFIFQQRNKSLLNQVKHVSFQQNAGNNADPSLLLHKNQPQ